MIRVDLHSFGRSMQHEELRTRQAGEASDRLGAVMFLAEELAPKRSYPTPVQVE